MKQRALEVAQRHSKQRPQTLSPPRQLARTTRAVALTPLISTPVRGRKLVHMMRQCLPQHRPAPMVVRATPEVGVVMRWHRLVATTRFRRLRKSC